MTTFDQFIAMQASPNTRRAYRQDLTRWAVFLDGRLPDMDLVIKFKQGLEATLAPASAARTWAAVRSYYRWLGGENPFDRVKGPKVITGTTPRTPADRDVEALLAAIDTSDLSGLRHRTIITLLLNGLRAQEVVDLRHDSLFFDVVDDETSAWVLRVVGKGRKERLVPANDEAVAAVHAYQQAARASLWLVSDYDGSQLTYKQVEAAVYKWAKVAGVDMHPHALRHHYATRLTRAGVNVLQLQQLLGHARADTTQRYVGLDLRDLVDAARKDPRAHVEQRPMLVAVSA